MGPAGLPVLHRHGEFYLLPGAVEEGGPLIVVQILNGGEYVEAEVLRHGGEVLPPPAVDVVVVEGHRPVGYGELRVGDDEGGVELHLDTEAVAALAGAEGAVEGEDPGLQLLEDDAADGAGHLRGVEPLLPLRVEDEKEPSGPLQGRLAGLDEPRAVLPGVEAVEDDLDVMLSVPVEVDLFVGSDDGAIDPRPGEPLGV